MGENACAVPLVQRLLRCPVTNIGVQSDGPAGEWTNYPVRDLMHEAADRIAALEAEVSEWQTMARDATYKNGDLEAQLAGLRGECVWTYSGELEDSWDGTCGIKWQLENDGPAANGMNYCPRCGGKLRQAAQGGSDVERT